MDAMWQEAQHAIRVWSRQGISSDWREGQARPPFFLNIKPSHRPLAL